MILRSFKRFFDHTFGFGYLCVKFFIHLEIEARIKSDPCGGGMEPSSLEEIHLSLLAFLKKLGYRQTEQIFKEEAKNVGIELIALEMKAEQDSFVHFPIITGKGGESESHGVKQEGQYEQMFSKLKNWIFESLDFYRDELCQVLYPTFVHSFLDLIAKNCSSEGKKWGGRIETI